MGASVSEQTIVFLAMSVCGAVIGILFDLFRSFRLLARPKGAAVHVSDFLFCLLAMTVLFGGLIYFNNGQLRWYVFLGLILGGILYFLICSAYLLSFFMFIERAFVKIIRIILKILLTPARFLYKILCIPIYRMMRKFWSSILQFAGRFKMGVKKAVTKEKARSNPKRKGKQKKSKLLTLLFVALLGFMFVKGVMQQPQITKNKEAAAELKRQIEYEEKRLEEVNALKEKVNTDEYISKVAQEKLGLVKREAKIFIDAADKQ